MLKNNSSIKPLEIEPVNRTTSVWNHLMPSSRTIYNATTSAGTLVQFWKAAPLSPLSSKKQKQKGFDTSFACHAATIGSHKWPQGPLTPYGDCIDTFLKEYFEPIDENMLLPGDVIAWRDEDGDISHTARLTCIYRDERGLLGKTRLSSKNGAMILREHVRLETLNRMYGMDIIFFREKSSLDEALDFRSRP